MSESSWSRLWCTRLVFILVLLDSVIFLSFYCTLLCWCLPSSSLGLYFEDLSLSLDLLASAYPCTTKRSIESYFLKKCPKNLRIRNCTVTRIFFWFVSFFSRWDWCQKRPKNFFTYIISTTFPMHWLVWWFLIWRPRSLSVQKT